MVLERGRVGRGASWAAAGILAPQVEADTDDKFFRLCFESNRMYPDLAAELLDETGIDVELARHGTLYLAFDADDEKEFDHRFAWQTAAGLNLERLDPSHAKALEPDVSGSAIGGLYFPNDGQVENRKLVGALGASAKLLGVDIREGIEVQSVLSDQGKVRGVATTQGRIPADRVLITTGAWTSHIELGEARLPVEVKPIRGQMICYRPHEVAIRHVIYSRRGYLVPRADGRLLAGATAEDVGFDSGVTDEAASVAAECRRRDSSRTRQHRCDRSLGGFAALLSWRVAVHRAGERGRGAVRRRRAFSQWHTANSDNRSHDRRRCARCQQCCL